MDKSPPTLGLRLFAPTPARVVTMFQTNPITGNSAKAQASSLDATQEPFAKNYGMYSYITRELTDLVASEFPLDMSRQAITGHSMGGHGALTIAA
uniref:S-formylglutathione hydrolase n=1 Tax=uncultured Brucella sp. TaxID=577589 RepID=A0A060BX97_9HYPH|nr:CAZy families CE1 protein [uncultured Brucella sp.]